MEKLNLINGNFSADEAKEILMSIFSAKINFHTIKNLSNKERFGEEDALSVKRLPELQNSVDKILKIVSECKSQGKELSILSEVIIKITDKEQQ